MPKKIVIPEVKACKKRIKSAIYSTGNSLDGFCKENDVSISSLFIYKSYPNATTIMKVAKGCNVTADWILFGEEKKE